jgi:uncharacterized membrane protein
VGRTRTSISLTPGVLALLIGLFGALPLVVLTPPFQVPDEQQHFARAYQLSEGTLWATVRGHAAGGYLPSSIAALTVERLGTLELKAPRPVRHENVAKTLSGLRQPLDAGKQQFIDFSGGAFYSPLPYTPQALAIAIGRLLGAGPLALLYLARAFNALASVAIVAWGVHWLPRGKTTALVLGLLPMALFEYASASADGLTIATAFLYSAVALKGSLEGRWSVGALVVAAVCGSVFCSLKPVYAPLLLLGAPALMKRSPGRGQAVVALLFVPLLVTAAWFGSAKSTVGVYVPGADLGRQLGWLAQQPLKSVAVLATTLKVEGPRLVLQTIGVFGWVTVPLLAIGYPVAVAGLLLSLLANAPGLRMTLFGYFVVLAATAVTALLIAAACYLYFTPVAWPSVIGMQGRYFLPVLPAWAVLLGGLSSRATPSLRLIAMRTSVGLVAANALIMQVSIARAYGLV